MSTDTELERQTKLPDAPPDEPPVENVTEKEAQEQYDDPQDAAFEDPESAAKLAEEVGFKKPPGDEGMDETGDEATDAADTEVTDAADDSASEEPEQKVDEADAFVREQATELHLPDYMIKALPREDLARFVRESYLKSGQAQRQPDTVPEAKPEPPVAKEEFKFDFDPAVMDDDVRLSIESNLQRMHKQHQSDMDALRKQYGEMGSQMEAQAQKAQQEAVVRERTRFDEWVASQNDAELFGEGASSAMDTNSSQYRARSDVWDMKDTIVAGIKSRGGTMPPEVQLLRWASNSVHAGTNGKQAVTEVARTLKKNASQTVARAGSNRPKKVSKLDELDRGFEEMFRNDPGRDDSLENDMGDAEF